MPRRTLSLLFALSLAAPLAQADDDTSWTSILADFFMGPRTTESFHSTARVPAGKTLEIKGVNGRIVAEPASGPDAVVDAVKQGRRHKPSEVRIETVAHAGGITICAVYPTPAGARPNECGPGEKGHMSTKNNDVEVEFHVKVPVGVAFVARTVNGGVEASGLTEAVAAYTVNGSVNVRTQGQARAETVNGSITAGLGRAEWSGAPLRFGTVNGSITVDLPSGANTSVDAETVNGRIQTDFTLAQTSTQSRTRLAGIIGQGGRALELETVNGSITLHRQ